MSNVYRRRKNGVKDSRGNFLYYNGSGSGSGSGSKSRSGLVPSNSIAASASAGGKRKRQDEALSDNEQNKKIVLDGDKLEEGKFIGSNSFIPLSDSEDEDLMKGRRNKNEDTENDNFIKELEKLAELNKETLQKSGNVKDVKDQNLERKNNDLEMKKRLIEEENKKFEEFEKLDKEEAKARGLLNLEKTNMEFEILEENEKLMDRIYDDSKLIKQTELKYKGKNFHPLPYTKKQLLNKIKPYYDLIPKILSGDEKSYFYGLAKKVQSKSDNETMSQDEFLALPMRQFSTGYIGKVRSSMISSKLKLKYHDLFQLKFKKNQVIQFWNLDNFVSFVLVPELLSRFIKDEFKFQDLDDSYDLMEWTSDYGTYIMDKIDIKDQEYISDNEDDEDMKATKKKLCIVDDQILKMMEKNKNDDFTGNLLGMNDLLADSEDDL
ncbi:hypothetical protein PACTADRAFT_33763 [Pachysolen tannophilus NRRL Y-2460]|uniref:Restriction of telomere capping protein 4 n=1 Tax=Pachysolen tannophilus NRRL Y-2460 TaxID=669874 RepID=A0A1E4TTX1_PACTA|nr:hypothetical protein PACTADRAFT_33763 [Pachysolen tannophilus NRRL Y-2460]